MLSNAYFLAKFRFDTAGNEPAKNLQKFANYFAIMRKEYSQLCTRQRRSRAVGGHVAAEVVVPVPEGLPEGDVLRV